MKSPAAIPVCLNSAVATPTGHAGLHLSKEHIGMATLMSASSPIPLRSGPAAFGQCAKECVTLVESGLLSLVPPYRIAGALFNVDLLLWSGGFANEPGHPRRTGFVSSRANSSALVDGVRAGYAACMMASAIFAPLVKRERQSGAGTTWL